MCIRDRLEVAGSRGLVFAPGPVLALGRVRAGSLTIQSGQDSVVPSQLEVVAEVGSVVLEAFAVGAELGLGVLAALGGHRQLRGRDQEFLPILRLGGLRLPVFGRIGA